METTETTIPRRASDDDIASVLEKASNDMMRELALTMPEIDKIEAANRPEGASVIDWDEEPVTLHEFINDPWHMNQPPLSQRQREDLEGFLGLDPKLMFSRTDGNDYREAVLVWGKGGGKDWVCSMVQCYLVYVLLCMKDCRRVIGLAPKEPVDILNVAYSAKQASEVYFTKFTLRVLDWQWLKHRYPIIRGRKMVNPELHQGVALAADGGNFVSVGAGMVHFPLQIRAISEHSESEGYEGYNILFWVMDEAAAFRSAGKKANANKVYSTLRTSSVSRFPRIWRGIMISYPRSADDFIMTKYHAAEFDPTVFRSLAHTWVVNPTKSIEEFENDRITNPVEYEAKYKCNPPPRFGAAFDPVAVDLCVDHTRRSLVETKDVVLWQEMRSPEPGGAHMRRQFVGKALIDVRIHDLKEKATPRVFHVDGGLTGCPAAMIIAHGEPVMVGDPPQALNRVVVDAILQWRPNPRQRLQVSLNNIAALISAISRHVKFVRGTYDQWNSQSSIEALFLSRIPVELHNIDADDYMMLEGLINLGCVAIPGDRDSEWLNLTNELKNLVRYDIGGRVKYDKPKEEGETLLDNFGGPRYTKDIADCLAGVTRLLNDPEQRVAVGGSAVPKSTRMISTGAPTGSPLTVRKMTGFMPPKMPGPGMATEAGYMGQQMNTAGRMANQHALLSDLGDGRVVLKAPSPNNGVRFPRSVIHRKRR